MRIKLTATGKLFIGYILVVILSLLLITHCARAQTTVDYYIDTFQADAQAYGVVLRRRPPRIIEKTPLYMYDHVVNKTIPVEAYTDHTHNTIYFNTDSWMYNNNLQVLVYHECGHYYFNKIHTEQKSIMNINIWGWGGFTWDDMSTSHQNYFKEELFKY